MEKSSSDFEFEEKDGWRRRDRGGVSARALPLKDEEEDDVVVLW